MAFRRRYNRSNRFPRRRRGRVSRRPKVSKKIRTYVKRAIHKQIENKEWIGYGTNLSITSAASTAPTGQPVFNTLGQGTNGSGRTGDCIKCVKGTIKGYVNLLPYDATNNPLSTAVYVKVWLLRNITINAQQGVSDSTMTNEWASFFRVNSGGLGLTNSLVDLTLPINDDKWRVLGSKVMKLGASYASASGQVGTGGYFDNSSMSRPFYFNFGKYCKKMLKYDNSTNRPSNENCYLVFQAINADGSATAVRCAEYHYTIHMKYEDA